jgi:hypothetical protein
MANKKRKILFVNKNKASSDDALKEILLKVLQIHFDKEINKK